MSILPLKDVMSRLIGDSLVLPALWAAGTFPLDIYEEGNNLVVKALLPPGINPEDLDIEVSESNVVISGEIKLEMVHKRENYFLNERRYGQVSRSVTLPYEVKDDQVEARFKEGILILTLPKVETTKGKNISMKPEAKADQPVAKAVKPEAKADQPVAKAVKPEAKADMQEVKAEKPKAKAEKPAAKTEMPEPKADKPVDKAEKPEVKAEKPKAKAGKPEAKAEKPKSNGEKPVAKVEKPGAKAEKPKSKADQPMMGVEKPEAIAE